MQFWVVIFLNWHTARSVFWQKSLTSLHWLGSVLFKFCSCQFIIMIIRCIKRYGSKSSGNRWKLVGHWNKHIRVFCNLITWLTHSYKFISTFCHLRVLLPLFDHQTQMNPIFWGIVSYLFFIKRLCRASLISKVTYRHKWGTSFHRRGSSFALEFGKHATFKSVSVWIGLFLALGNILLISSTVISI